MGKRLHKIGIFLAICIMVCCQVLPVFAQEVSDESEKNAGIVQIRNIKNEDSFRVTFFGQNIDTTDAQVSSYAGTDFLNVSGYGVIGKDSSVKCRTLILIDNSVSFSNSRTRNKLDAILERVIWNHQPNELIAARTLEAEEPQLDLDFSENYDAIRTGIAELKYKNKSSNTYDELYNAIVAMTDNTSNTYDKIVLVTDGRNDGTYGISYEELLSKEGNLSTRCPVYVIATKSKNKGDNLKELAGVARVSNGNCYVLEDYEKVEDAYVVADEIVANTSTISFYSVDIPNTYKGTTEIVLNIDSKDKQYSFQNVIELPAYTTNELKEMKDAQKAAQKSDKTFTIPKDESAQPLSFTQKLVMYKDRLIGSGTASAIIVLSAVLVLFFICKKLYFFRKSDRGVHIKLKKDEATAVEVLDDMPKTGKFVVINVNRPDEKWYFDTAGEIMIGRSKARCDISFEEDKMLASRQAMIFFEDGVAYIQLVTNVNAVKVNGEELEDKCELMDQVIVEIGKEKLRIQYE